MIILDTNIVSEFMGSPPHESVYKWLTTISASQLYLTSITRAEILVGLQLMADGRRKRALSDDYNLFEREVVGGRILAFERPHAEAMASFISARRSAGLNADFADSQIAAITHVSGAKLATRNTKDFESWSLDLFNPFENGGS